MVKSKKATKANPAKPKTVDTAKMFFVEIQDRGTDEVVERMGPMPNRQAIRTQAGASINLNHADYRVVVVPATDQ